MSNALAKILSYLLHPVLFPILGVYACMKLAMTSFPRELLMVTIVLTFIGTYLIPVFLTLLFYKLGIIKNIQMTEAKDRRLPYLITAIFFIFTDQQLTSFDLPSELFVFLLASSITILFHLTLLGFFKPSAHMAGIGGFTALIMYLSYQYEIGLLIIIIPLIIGAGFLASARLKLLAHNNLEIIFGYASGFLIILMSLLYFR